MYDFLQLFLSDIFVRLPVADVFCKLRNSVFYPEVQIVARMRIATHRTAVRTVASIFSMTPTVEQMNRGMF